MKYPEITLRRGKEQSLQRLHPWVFSGAVAHIPDSLEEGDIVDVITCDGRKIATGHYQIGSITIRILSWEDTEINDAFYRKRLEAAYGLRQALRLVTRRGRFFARTRNRRLWRYGGPSGPFARHAFCERHHSSTIDSTA